MSYMSLLVLIVHHHIILGVLEHGKAFTVYRTFHNVTKDSNLSIYVLLCRLREFHSRHGRYPEKIYLQVYNFFYLDLLTSFVILSIGRWWIRKC